MAHEIMEHDTMMSVREMPWHGLGRILADYPTIPEAVEASGLSWNVREEPVKYSRTNPSTGRTRMLPYRGHKLLIREDNGYAVGLVGKAYVPYQNSQMWAFIEDFVKASGSKLETAGSLRNGAITWVLSESQAVEYVPNDEIRRFFLFKNCFDGGKSIEILFTNVRVVCANTMAMAIEDAQNIYRVRHLINAETRLRDIQKSLTMAEHWNAEMMERMKHLATVQMVEEEMVSSLEDIYEMPKAEDAPDTAILAVQKIINETMELVENGRGVDIPGVKGTAYGLLQAIIERADYKTRIRETEDRTFEEAHFENVMWKTSNLKTTAMDYLFANAA